MFKKVKSKKEPIDYGITKDHFFAILEKVSRPIKKSESEKEIAQTSESHRSDGCNGTHTAANSRIERRRR